MRSPIDERLRREVSLFRLVYACEQCAHFDDEHAVCSQGYPVAEHLAASLDERGSLVFCKSFEAS